MIRLLLNFFLLASCALILPAQAKVVTAQSGFAELRYHPGAMAALGIRPISANETVQPLLTAVDAIQVIAPNGHFQGFGAGLTPDLRLHLLAGEQRIDQLLRAQAGSDGRSLDWIDSKSQVWLRFDYLHSQLERSGTELSFRNGNARVGPALARQLSDRSESEGALLGEGRLRLTLSEALVSDPRFNSCSPPTWPSAKAIADVALIGIDSVFQMRCSTPGCDGPGANNPKVVIAPSATLQNVGNADIPWYQKFSGNLPPYGNDQHPFLVWNMYKIESDGSLRQIGQSGTKHAFVTIPMNCSCGDNQLLGRQCVDIYSAVTNDTPTVGDCTEPDGCHQGPRREILPLSGEWARCGSIYDPDCDGNNSDAVAYGPFEHRMLIDEADLDESLVEKYLIEAWYLVRDDAFTENNIGSQFVNVDWLPPAAPPAQGRWNIQIARDFKNGSALQNWFSDPATPNAWQKITRVQTASGSLDVVSRARTISATQWRYDVSIFNRDAAMASTSGAQPNLRLLDSRGVTRFTVILPNGASASDLRFVDLDQTAGNNWGLARIGDELLFSTAAADLHWGTLYTFGFDSDVAPGIANARIALGEQAAATSFDIIGPSVERLLSDGFE